MATYQREKAGATIHQDQTSGAEIEWNWGERKISAVTARKLVGGQQKTNNENAVRKFERNKILVG